MPPIRHEPLCCSFLAYPRIDARAYQGYRLPPRVTAAIVPTLYEPEEFATLYHADKERAIALIAAMSEPQRVCQALAYAVWLAYHGLEIDLDTVLAAWEPS